MNTNEQQNTEVPLLLDVDTGTDDALAILYLLAHPRARLLGITTAAGNVSAAQATANTRNILEWSGYDDIPVVQGADAPLYRPWAGIKRDFHGEDGLGNWAEPVTPDNAALTTESAAQFLVRHINEHPQALTLVFVGRLTNLAEALALDSTLPSKVKKLVIMGGALRSKGNITPYAESNIHGDPEAADIVFRAGFPLVMTGLDVTFQAMLQSGHAADIDERLAVQQPQVAKLIRHVLQFRMKAYESKHGIYASPLHDPLAAAVALEPWLVTTELVKARIQLQPEDQLGRTLEVTNDTDPHFTPIHVCTEVKVDEFLAHFIDILALHGKDQHDARHHD
ncbi:nucleoside hydrolase [Paenibacillus sp. WLX1005]|uniref:nucleoside hydrolase n=1 Tax=Paenibacillus sp. WLX1005 TaxID=3243766 RepID=UPI003984324F